MQERITAILNDSAQLKQQVAQSLGPDIEQAVRMIVATLREGGKVALCGNGGSAADAQHIAGELVGRFKRERQGLAAFVV